MKPNLDVGMKYVKIFFTWLRRHISPAFVMMLFAAFVLWYITKLGDVYTVDHSVTIVVDNQTLSVDCTIRGKGTDLISYKWSSRRSSFQLSDKELTFDGEVRDADGNVTHRHISPVSLQQALAARMSDVEVISVGVIEPIMVDYQFTTVK